MAQNINTPKTVLLMLHYRKWEFHNVLSSRLKKTTHVVKKEMAEGKGFEPPKGVSSLNDLANRRLQPLGHPSARMGHGAVPPRRMQKLIYSLRHSLSNAFISSHEARPRPCPITTQTHKPALLIFHLKRRLTPHPKHCRDPASAPHLKHPQ